jgi:hypothetical protein
MAENTNVNNNASVVVVGRTAPVPTGQQTAEKSIPVVIASDQDAIPVEEQNKQQSEVALSLLGIPRSEVALGIFADVNTYDVNPSEWSAVPEQLRTILSSERVEYTDIQGQQDWGLSHVPSEAGAHIEAPANENAILTSKRFFRYQPGRVSAGTFGVKFSRGPYTYLATGDAILSDNTKQHSAATCQVRNPSIKKYGVFDKYDGYYYESINEGRGDNFTCVRRTQSLIVQKSKEFFYTTSNPGSNPRQFDGSKNSADYGNMELGGGPKRYSGDAVILRDGLINIHAGLFDQSLLKEKKEIPIVKSSGTTLTIEPREIPVSGFTYNNVTRKATVTTSVSHNLKEGDSVSLRDLLVSCNTGSKLYPNMYAQDTFRIISAATNTLTVFIGKSLYDSVFSQTYVSGGTLSRIATASLTGSYTNITGFTYNTVSGVARIKIADGTAHGLEEGDKIQIQSVSLNGGVTFPQTNRPDIFFVRRIVSPGEFEIGIGKEAVSELTVANTYSSGGSFRKLTPTFETSKNITGFDYDEANGTVTITSSNHGFVSGERIKIADVLTSCSYGPKTYPAKNDPDVFPIYDVTSNQFSFYLDTSTIVHTYVSGGRVVVQGLRPGNSIYVYKNGSTINNTVDGGIYFVKSVSGNKITLTQEPAHGDDFATIFGTPRTTELNFGTSDYRMTPTNAVYNPTTGVMTITVNNHGMSNGDTIKILDYSLGFTCTLGPGTKYYPRPTNASPANGYPSSDPASGEYLPISNVTANTFDVQVLSIIPSSNTSPHTFVSALSNCIVKGPAAGPHIITPAPFILPGTLKYQYRGTVGLDKDVIETLNPYGCFPYRYVYGQTDDDIVGYISTDVKLTTAEGAAAIKDGIDYVNNKLLKDWVYNHVQPRYWNVYEYRVPRSRFSGEKVDGQTERDILYSDVVYSDGSNHFPGEPVIDAQTDDTLTRTSNWNLEPANVTMYKIEYSWYGAVGALFLAYVPLDSGEARWVRVHHLRASNQLKVSSLGNPTLPITYYVYGGGTQYCYGYKNDTRQINYIANSSSYSEFIVKYGASYYIDGGDRGTVRLFNYGAPNAENVYGSKFSYTILSSANKGDASDPADPYPYIDLTGASGVNAPNISGDYSYYIGASVITPSREPGVKVIWVDNTNERIYFNKQITVQAGTYQIIADRPKILLGFKCREQINGVRNRVQIYPTKLSVGSSAVTTLRLLKTPIFQTKDVITGVFNTTYTSGGALDIGSIAKPTKLDSSKISNSNYLEDGSKTYGYFRGFYEGNSNTVITVLGVLQNISGSYYFNALSKTNLSINIFGNFLRAGEFYEPNPTSIGASSFNPSSTPLAALSAIEISDEQRTPIPGTGTQITTLFAPASGEQYDLSQFFDYNKDYLSFPLTDLVDTLYVVADTSQSYNSSSPHALMTAALTWEEQ